MIAEVFRRKYQEGAQRVSFEREELAAVAAELGVKLPKNLGDIVYSFRYRTRLPESIMRSAPSGLEWIIRATGQAKYEFSLTAMPRFVPNASLAETKIPDATPGIIAKFASGDEQRLLARLRYNRLVDVFTGVTCYSLQSHFRTTAPGIGQVETDEVYLGVDRRGAQYVIPVQAKGGTDQIGVIQIEQDIAICASKFPLLICRPVAAQFLEKNLIAMFLFEATEHRIAVISEKHYRLVPPDNLTKEDLESYGRRPIENI